MRTTVKVFVEEYKEQHEFYQRLAQICAMKCKEHLHNNGIRCIVTSRAKSPESLEEKINYRMQEKNYRTVEDIRQDIGDLAGVRIALYFPGDILEVEKILRAKFILADEPSRFDGSYLKYDRRFAGYRATHFHVKFREADAIPGWQYSGEVIEVQVASVLMHAWAEVEHDLAYKSPEEGISEMEYALLAQLNGLVHSGEVTLEQLQIALNQRIEKQERPFSNHYELSTFIQKNIPGNIKQKITEPTLGRVDLLFSLIKRLGLDRPSHLRKYLHMVEEGVENRPVCFQMIEKILADNVEKYGIYKDLAKYAGEEAHQLYSAKFEEDYRSSKRLIDEFLLKWVEMEREIRKLMFKEHTGLGKLQYLFWGSAEQAEALPVQMQELYQIRNCILHGIHVPHQEELEKAIRTLDEIIRELTLEAEE